MSSPRLPLAAIDAGSNTIHLVVARPRDAGCYPEELEDLEILADDTELVRLGADVAATGGIGRQRIAHAVATIAKQRARAESLGAQMILGIATEGVRAAANGAELLERARAEAGVVLHLISGEQEAALTYWGATSGSPDGTQRRAVVDLGGGSMELVVGQGACILWRVSVPVGSGTLLDACITTDPPRAEDLAHARKVAADALRPIAAPLPVDEVVACGGAATTLIWLTGRTLAPALAAAASPTGDYLPGCVGQLSHSTLETLVALLTAISASEVATRYGIDPARAPLLAPGALALLAALDRLGAEEVVVSRRGIREGAILAHAHRGEEWLTAAAQGNI